MAVPRALRPLLGPSVGSAAIALLALASAVVYLLFSKVVRMMATDWTYLQFVLASLLKTPHARVFAFGFSPTASALVTCAVFIASCIMVGRLVAQTFRGSPAAAPMAWTAALAASVVPTIAIAIVRWPDGGGSITNTTISTAQCILVAIVWWWSRRAGAVNNSSNGESRPSPGNAISPWLWLGVALASCYALTILVNGLSGIFGYDSFSDHLVVPARWLVTGRLERGLPEEMVSFYPGNFELLVRWTLSLGTDRLAFLLSFGSCIAVVWVVFRIALELGQARAAALMAALGAASLQVMAYQSIVVYSDSYTALCLLLATWLLIIWARNGASDNRLTCGFGVALGLALGAKYSAGPPVVILGLVWLWQLWRTMVHRDAASLDNRLNSRAVAASLVIFGVSVLPAMAYWYVRNTVEQHNPLFPLSIAGLPGLHIGELLANVPGPKTFFERLTWPWTEVGHVAAFETGLGPLFASVVVLAVCAVPFAWNRTRPEVRLTWIVLIGASIAWWRTGVLVPRYGFFPLLLSFVFIGELWSAWSSRLLAVVFGAAVSATMLSVGHQMLAGAAYNELFFDPAPRVPAVIDSLPPSRILNAAGQPSGYYARGHDQRHQVINPFKGVTAEDVLRLKPQFLLLPQAREPEFVVPLGLTLMGRWEKAGQPPTALWRVTAP